jgi:hypothetical protein
MVSVRVKDSLSLGIVALAFILVLSVACRFAYHAAKVLHPPPADIVFTEQRPAGDPEPSFEALPLGRPTMLERGVDTGVKHILIKGQFTAEQQAVVMAIAEMPRTHREFERRIHADPTARAAYLSPLHVVAGNHPFLNWLANGGFAWLYQIIADIANAIFHVPLPPLPPIPPPPPMPAPTPAPAPAPPPMPKPMVLFA